MGTRVRWIVLVGLPGAGKSTVGPLLARRLGVRFIDLDDEIERRAGRSVADVFRDSGEPEFRRLEREATTALPRDEALVLAPGGGWIAQPGIATSIPHGSRLIWLRVALEEAATRLKRDARPRPLLAGDAVARLRELEERREPLYRTADTQIDTSGRGPDEIADEILESLRSPEDE